MTDPVREALADAEDALQKLMQWVDAYPLDILPEPDFKRARAALAAYEITLDSVSASNMRHVLSGVRKIVEPAWAAARAALAQEPASPIAWICADDLRRLERDGAATVYQKEQAFVLMAPQDQTPLYAAPEPSAVATLAQEPAPQMCGVCGCLFYENAYPMPKEPR